MHGDAWTAERVELLKQLWQKGESAEVIAARLGGLTRSAVLGKIFRLRLDASKTAATSGRQSKSAAAGAAPERVPRASAAGPVRPVGVAAPEKDALSWRHNGVRRQEAAARASEAARQAAARRGLTLHELTNHTCRWPYRRPGTRRYFFCGAPEADLERGIPYCPRHMRRAYAAEVPTASEIKPVGLKRFASRPA